MNTTRTLASDTLKGLAFEIADLVFIRSWADRHDFQMLVRLDHGAEGEEYEEVVTFRTTLRPLSRLIMWRNAEAVFVQPLVGRRQQFANVGEALESLLPKQRVVLSDITATAWPTE
jgi:hypothetical protein